MSRRTEGTIPSPEGTAVVLTVSRLSADLVRLREILAQGSWKLHEVSDCCEAWALLRNESVPVLLCECDHADGNWEDLLRATARQVTLNGTHGQAGFGGAAAAPVFLSVDTEALRILDVPKDLPDRQPATTNLRS